MDNIALLQNQLVIMKALLTVVKSEEIIKELKEQIIFTEARIRALS